MTLMECKIDLALPHTRLPDMFARQRAALEEAVQQHSGCHIVRPGMAGGARPCEPAAIPGVASPSVLVANLMTALQACCAVALWVPQRAAQHGQQGQALRACRHSWCALSRACWACAFPSSLITNTSTAPQARRAAASGVSHGKTHKEKNSLCAQLLRIARVQRRLSEAHTCSTESSSTDAPRHSAGWTPEQAEASTPSANLLRIACMQLSSGRARTCNR